MKHKSEILILAVCLFLLCSCSWDPSEPKDNLDFLDYMSIPQIVYPDDNPESEKAWELGKMLFYDSRLSKDGKVNCGSSHNPDLAFSDQSEVSLGAFNRPGARNASPLFNLGFHPYFTREGGVPTLEMQVLVPIQEFHEFNTNIVDLARELGKDTTYQRLSHEAYGRAFNHFVITRAISNFERSLISINSRFDQFARGEKSALSELEMEGMKLFFGDRAKCSGCHSGFNFTNYSFSNNGLYKEYSDPGRMRLTGNENDRSQFKVPSLRNVEVTAPYMHDGKTQTLSDVINHYSEGVQDNVSKSTQVEPLHLSNKEKKALVAFLKCLTDQEFLTKKNLKKE